MPTTSKKAILAVSFGTSYAETREKNIDRIEEDIRKACSDPVSYTHLDVYKRQLVGVRRETIGNLENGKYNPSLVLAWNVAKLFGVAIEEIFTVVEE